MHYQVISWKDIHEAYTRTHFSDSTDLNYSFRRGPFEDCEPKSYCRHAET